MNNKQISERITELRKKHNLSQQDLANKLNVSNKTISKWECGNGTPDIDSLNKMSKIFGITLDKLVNDDKTNTEDKVEILEVKNVKGEGKDNKKNIIIASIISSIVSFLVAVSLLCYFFIPRNPTIENSSVFTINKETQTVSCVVENSAEKFEFSNSIQVPRTNNWYVYYDLNGLKEIKSKTVNLQVGDNTFYIIVENSVGDKKTYTVNIRRRPLYVVSFNTLGGNTIVNEIVQEGDFATYNEPTRKGYIFNGWDFDFTTPITSNITITASWIAKNLTINYFSNNGTSSSSIQNVTYDSLVTLKSSNEFMKKGYTLSSWNTKEDGSGTSYQVGKVFNYYNIQENISLYAQWTINQYSISATKNLTNAGTIQGNGRFDYNSTRTLTATTNTGYTWIGWYSKNNVLQTTSQSLVVTISDIDAEYVAKWSANKYLVSLDVNNGNALEQSTKELIFGENFILPITTRIEATFLGWFDRDGKQYTNNDGQSIIAWDKAEQYTLIAHYKINEYQVSLNINNNKAGTVNGAGLKEYGSSVILAATTNEGYHFVGWYDGVTQLTTNLQYTFTMSNYSVSYTAKWQANNYVITMNVNNGVELVDNTEEVTFDSAYTLPITSRDGYAFAGWYLGVNGTGVQITDANGNSISAWNIADNKDVYAKWDLVTYSLTYSLNNGNVTTNNPEAYSIEDLDIRINNPIRSGYVFEGWIGTEIESPTKELIINAGSYGNRHYGAVWTRSSDFVAVANVNDLKNIANNLGGYYYLTQDIDINGVEFNMIGDEQNPFTGVLDGCGFSISNINDLSGLFYNNSGLIKNLKIVNFQTMGNGSEDNIGAIAVINDGIIENCVTNGSISYDDYHSILLGGGICAINNGTIKHCINNMNVSIYGSDKDTGARAGGIAAINNGLIYQCYNTGIISTKVYYDGYGYAAGITAKNTGEVNSCFNIGNINTIIANRVEFASMRAESISIKSSNGIMKNCYTLESCRVWDAGSRNSIYIMDEGAVVENTNPVTKSQLIDKTLMSFGEYYNDTDMILYSDNVWVFDGENYPTLYWQK